MEEHGGSSSPRKGRRRRGTNPQQKWNGESSDQQEDQHGGSSPQEGHVGGSDPLRVPHASRAAPPFGLRFPRAPPMDPYLSRAPATAGWRRPDVAYSVGLHPPQVAPSSVSCSDHGPLVNPGSLLPLGPRRQLPPVAVTIKADSACTLCRALLHDPHPWGQPPWVSSSASDSLPVPPQDHPFFAHTVRLTLTVTATSTLTSALAPSSTARLLVTFATCNHASVLFFHSFAHRSCTLFTTAPRHRPCVLLH